MTSDTVSSFYKILKDETNQKILVLINIHGSLSYTDLLEKSEVISERMLNYHIKTLDDLLSKNEKNQYILTEKGQIALKTLKENSANKKI